MAFPARSSLFPVGALLPATFKTLLAQWFDGVVAQEDPVSKYGALQNLSLSLSVAGSALTIALKDRAGADPSASSPAVIPFRNATAATGDFAMLPVTAAASLVVSSGSTLGTTNSAPFRLWIVSFNDAGTHRLGVVNCLSGTNIFPLKDDTLASSTAEGGAGAADSAHVIYTGTAVTSKAMRVLGYAEWSSGLATAGTWSAGPSKVQLFGPGVPLPGQLVQQVGNVATAVATGTTVLPVDNTVPQITEGNQFMTQAITPVSAMNLLEVDGVMHLSNSVGSAQIMALFQDATAGALAASLISPGGVDFIVDPSIRHRMRAGTTASTTFRLRAGSSSGTTTFNGSGGLGLMGGVLNSRLNVAEVMA